MSRLTSHHLEALTFVAFLCAGLLFGSHLKQSPAASVIEVEEVQLHISIPALPDGERLILLVNVDRLDSSSPHLESMWLLTYYLDGRPIQWLPVYPLSGSQAIDLDQQILKTFALVNRDGEYSLSPEFLSLLSRHNYWLSGYFVMDQTAKASLVDIFGGLLRNPDGDQASTSETPSHGYPTEVATQQALQIRQVCLVLSRSPEEHQWSSLEDLMPEHILTDLDVGLFIAEIQILITHPTTLTCEFPTLAALP